MIQTERATLRRYIGEGCWSYLHFQADRERALIHLICEFEVEPGLKQPRWARPLKIPDVLIDDTFPRTIAMDWVLLGNLWGGELPMPGIEEEVQEILLQLHDLTNHHEQASRIAALQHAVG